jgi:hypothetical protein
MQGLPGVEPIVRSSGLSQIPKVNRAVLVGTKISPGQPLKKREREQLNLDTFQANLARTKRQPVPIRFHGSVDLDPMPVGRDAGKIAEEVIQHLTGLPSSKVGVTLEITAEISGGVPDNVVRTVTENSRTLKFKTHGFEEK